MESITIYPENEKQKSLLKSLLEEMKIRFTIDADDTLLSEDDFYRKIDRAIEEAEKGEVQKVSETEQKELLGL